MFFYLYIVVIKIGGIILTGGERMRYKEYLNNFLQKEGDLILDRVCYRFQFPGVSTFHKPSDKISEINEDYVVVKKHDRTLAVPLNLFVVEIY